MCVQRVWSVLSFFICKMWFTFFFFCIFEKLFLLGLCIVFFSLPGGAYYMCVCIYACSDVHMGGGLFCARGRGATLRCCGSEGRIRCKNKCMRADVQMCRRAEAQKRRSAEVQKRRCTGVRIRTPICRFSNARTRGASQLTKPQTNTLKQIKKGEQSEGAEN